MCWFGISTFVVLGADMICSPVEVDVRSFGVRMPPSTAKDPNYGVMR